MWEHNMERKAALKFWLSVTITGCGVVVGSICGFSASELWLGGVVWAFVVFNVVESAVG